MKRWIALVVIMLLPACSQESLSGLPRQAATPVTNSNDSRPGEASSPVALSPTATAPEEATQQADEEPTSTSVSPTPTRPGDGEEVVFVGAGDIADCDDDGDELTAKLLDRIDGTVFTLGDNAYDDGTESEFERCYEPTWGRHKERTFPAPGNHDYNTDDAEPYYRYFGDAAGEEGKGYYSYNLGSWHIVVLNSNCGDIGGCDEGSDQERWLRADLEANPARCTLAYWHHPLFNAGRHDPREEVRPLWDALYDAGADVVLAGHDHNYQRFAPQRSNGDLDEERGIRQFVVGTAVERHYEIEKQVPNLEASNDDTSGVIRLTLRPGGYSWEFVPVEGQDFTDSGTGTCH